MPARIQTQVGGKASVTAGWPRPAPASVRRLRLEQVMTLPPRIQNQVAEKLGIVVTPSPVGALRSEYILTLPLRIQEQVRGTLEGPTT